MLSTPRSCYSCSACLDSNLDDSQNIKYNFIGNFDKDGLRNKYGYQTWNGCYKHEYAGNFLLNNMHDRGFYFIKKENSFSFFDGQFYNNKLEGYGQVIHDDGSVYEGLFKDNKRFGPGILTYPDGSQDVGFWNGNGLLRLSISVSSELIPKICNTSFSKVKLLRFKTIVPALPEKHDEAKDMMLRLGAYASFFDTYPQLYNYYVRNEHSLFFDSRYYDLAQLGSEVALIDVLEDESLMSMNINDTMTEYDDPCLCSNERCVHINRLIDEMNFELEKIQNDIVHLKKKLRTCADCCATEELDTDSKEKDEDKKNDLGSAIKYPSRVILADTDVSSKFKVSTDWNQMRLQSSSVELNAVHNENLVLNNNDKEEEKVSPNEVQREQFVNGTEFAHTDKVPVQKIICECTERHIPDVDFIISELGVLEKNEKFHEIILQYLQNILCKEITGNVNACTPKTFQVHVEHLLAWNNDQNIIDMMQHCFRYRNFENMLGFSVKSLLSGDRSTFGKMGKQEKLCIDFLEHCALDQLTEVRDGLMRYNIHPDLSDARGNRGLHFAVTNNSCDVIKQLANSGANLDAFNDECLTPLLLGILRYIAAINAVVSWECAFLPELVLNSDELEEVIHWRPHESLVNLREFIDSSSHLIGTDHYTSKLNNKSLDEISVRSKLVSQSRKSSNMRMNISYIFSTPFIEDYMKNKKSSPLKKNIELDMEQPELIENTIYTLLKLGADPNVGELPMCPVLLSIFTKNGNLVEMLLEKGANPNITSEEGLSALHILACLPFSSNNVNISERFLEYSCDPNKKTEPDFWSEQNVELIGENSDLHGVKLRGKTALQLICMRKDFDADNIEHQCTLVRMLIENGAICHNYYLGHTLLSLAVLRENVRLIETLYPYVEGTKTLGYNMGNILTVPGLNRFSVAKSFVKCRQVIDTMISLGMNPFDPVYTFPNVFEFFGKEHAEDVIENNRKIRKKLEAEYKKVSKYFTRHDVVKNSDKVAVAYIKETGRKILSGIYQYKALKHLMVLAEENSLNNNHAKSKAKLLTIDDAIKYIKIFIHHEKIELNDAFKNLLLKVLEYIRACHPLPKARKKKKSVKPLLNLKDEIEKLTEYDEEISIQLARYVLDSNPEKYEVCYHCLKKSRKKLIVCPLCGMGKFCSDICNKFNKKTKSKHPCNILFYNNPNSKNFEFFEFSNNNTKEVASARGRRLTLDPQRQRSEKFVAKKPRTSATSSIEITKEEDKQIINEAPFDPCCVKKNSVFFLCEENEYWKSVKKECRFLCSRGITEEEGDTKANSEFCVCYVPTEEHSEPNKFEEVSNNEEVMKRSLVEEKQKKINLITDQDIITDHFNKFLSRFKKKSLEVSHLENHQMKEQKTKDIKSFEIHINKHTIANGDYKDVVRSRNSSNERVKQDQTKWNKERGKNVDTARFNSKSTEPLGSDRGTSKKPKNIEEIGEPLNRTNMKRDERNIRKGVHSKYSEKQSAGDELKYVGYDKKTPHAILPSNRRKQQKYNHGSKTSSANKSGTQTKETNDKNIVINTKMTMDQSKELKGIHVDSTEIRNKNKLQVDRTSNKQYRRNKRDIGGTMNKEKGTDEKNSTRERQSLGTLKTEGQKKDFNNETKQNRIIHTWIKNKGFSPRQLKKQWDMSKKWPPLNQLEEKNVTGPNGQTSLYDSSFSKFKKFPKLHQYFLELLAQYFPQFNLNGLLFPFACFVDGQLYYKFAESSPYYCRTYSTV